MSKKFEKMSKTALIRELNEKQSEISKLKQVNRDIKIHLRVIAKHVSDLNMHLLLAEHLRYDHAEWTEYEEKNGKDYSGQLENEFFRNS